MDAKIDGQTAAIVFDDVHRRFGARPVLRGLSLRVRPGEIHALLGRNGSGKTTAMRILLGLLAPHAGRCAVLGTDSSRLGPAERARIGYVSEEHRLYGHMRVRDVLAFESATRPGFDRVLADGALRRCRIAPEVTVRRLSRGQRTQLALVVAVAARPAVLICDDPALGLDVVMRRELLDVMVDLLAGQGIPVLFSSHVLTDVERIADRVSILHEGRLIVDAQTDDLKRRVQKRFWEGDGPAPAGPGVLRAVRKRGGFDLLLLDADGALEARLRADGARLGPAAVPSLDDLFMDLTRGDDERLLPTPDERKEHAA
jgi:ABC-2 type transport system ATP-binding protein